MALRPRRPRDGSARDAGRRRGCRARAGRAPVQRRGRAALRGDRSLRDRARGVGRAPHLGDGGGGLMDPLERVSYFGGQRLMAADLNQQERYEIRLRRLLNSGLFSSGVVSGLEVTKVGARTLRVAPGLGLDHLGRELYLAVEAEVSVPNQRPVSAPGFYVIVRYRETPVPGGAGDCWPPARAVPPYRYRIDPLIELSDVYPDSRRCAVSAQDPTGDLNCGVVIAMVRVTAACEIDTVETGFRQ